MLLDPALETIPLAARDQRPERPRVEIVLQRHREHVRAATARTRMGRPYEGVRSRAEIEGRKSHDETVVQCRRRRFPAWCDRAAHHRVGTCTEASSAANAARAGLDVSPSAPL